MSEQQRKNLEALLGGGRGQVSNAIQPGSANKVIKHLRDCRTYRDLLQLKPSSECGTCCACHEWNKPTWQISTRASICRKCIDRKGDAVLGAVLKVERRARRWIKRHMDAATESPKWIATLTGASVEFVEAEIRRQSSSSSSGEPR